ncbi:MAG: histidine phosphotransferase family protein [Micavibrio sp.]
MTSASVLKDINPVTGESTAISPVVLELLASRICHDLISPVGAINNGIEFLEDMGADAGEEAIKLIAHSARQASVRLQAFRICYGAGGRDGNIKPEDIKKAFEALTEADGKVAQSWDPHADLGFSERPTGYCKILMGAMMLGAECLPKGGIIKVKAGDGEETVISAEGQDAIVRDGVEDAMAQTSDPSTLDPRLVHPFAISALAASYGLQISIKEKEQGRVVISLKRG